jgi:proline iminopeptidase
MARRLEARRRLEEEGITDADEGPKDRWFVDDFDKWAVLGHSFGGNVALEYALRYPDRLSYLVLLNTGAEGRWSLENASTVLAERGYSPEIVNLARRWLNGEVPPKESFHTLMKLGKAYNPHSGVGLLMRMALEGAWRSKLRPEALIFAAHHLLSGWSVIDRLGEIEVPTLVIAGKDAYRAHTQLAPKADRARRSQSARRADR